MSVIYADHTLDSFAKERFWVFWHLNTIKISEILNLSGASFANEKANSVSAGCWQELWCCEMAGIKIYGNVMHVCFKKKKKRRLLRVRSALNLGPDLSLRLANNHRILFQRILKQDAEPQFPLNDKPVPCMAAQPSLLVYGWLINAFRKGVPYVQHIYHSRLATAACAYILRRSVFFCNKTWDVWGCIHVHHGSDPRVTLPSSCMLNGNHLILLVTD